MSRCSQCKKKLGLMEYKCKCELIFCISHLHFAEHNCKYDHKSDDLKKLQNEMHIGPLVSKIEKI